VLKITINETTTEMRWVLQGRLFGPWVSELRAIWRMAHRNRRGRACIVDLNDVTFLDKGGERLLRTMSKEGAQFIATGIYIKHVLDQLKPNGKRGLLKVISCLFAALLGGVIVDLNQPAGDFSVSTWLTSITINQALTLLRKNRGSHEVSIAPLSSMQASPERPETNAVQGSTIELNSIDQRTAGNHGGQFFPEIEEGQHRAS
jgi:hypothetical protein